MLYKLTVLPAGKKAQFLRFVRQGFPSHYVRYSFTHGFCGGEGVSDKNRILGMNSAKNRLGAL
jgi:hypothetical protein